MDTITSRRDDKIRYVTERLERYPHLAVAPVGNPQPESLRDDKTFSSYVVVPFRDESGFAVWMFESQGQRNVFVRRSASHRQVPTESWLSYAKPWGGSPSERMATQDSIERARGLPDDPSEHRR